MAGPDPSDHFDGRRFFNPGVDTDRSLGQVLRWLLGRRRSAWPACRDDPVDPARLAELGADGGIALTYIGQATFLIQMDGLNILTDPMFSDRASPVGWAGPRRVRPPAVPLDRLPPIHLVLLSHNHYDHLDLPSLKVIARRWAPPIVTGLGNAAYLRAHGVGGAVDCDWWQTFSLAGGVRVTFVPAQHWSKRVTLARRSTLWGGHLVEGLAGRVYFAGDTGYPAQFGEIRRRLGSPDLALLPIGAYEPRWFMGPQHMNPEDAVRAHGDLGARLSVAMHFATFPLTDEGIDAPAADLALAMARFGLPDGCFHLPAFGRPLIWRSERPDHLEPFRPAP